MYKSVDLTRETPPKQALMDHQTYGPRREKTCLRGIRESEFQTSLVSYRDQLEDWNFTSSKFTYDTFQNANNRGADQTARMRRLVCACVVRKPPKTGFLASRPNCIPVYKSPFCRHTSLLPSLKSIQNFDPSVNRTDRKLANGMIRWS